MEAFLVQTEVHVQVCKLYVDVRLGHSAAFFSGGVKPLAAVSSSMISGALMTGRQITAPPQQQLREFSVGQWRAVTIPVTVKGSRALLKVYSDLKVHAEEPKVWYNIGLEPTIALVRPAFSRQA